jgi:hypothetical protein
MIYILQHLNDFWPGLLLCLVTGLCLVEIPKVKKALSDFAPTRANRAVVGLFVGAACFCGWTKGPVSVGSVKAQFITALASGGIVDVSGLVASTTESETVAAFADFAVEIVSAASQTVVNAQGDIDDVAFLITNETRQVVYIASDLPRADPLQHTNHNIAATVERVRQNGDGTELSLWCWYSEEPVVAPGVCAEIDAGAGWLQLEAITNYYPAIESINGVPCVRYDFAVPSDSRQVVFRPSYELGFGGTDTPLLVPDGGVTVETNGATRLPFTGTDSYFTGRVEVVYHGGIADTLIIDGQTVTNGVHEL